MCTANPRAGPPKRAISPSRTPPRAPHTPIVLSALVELAVSAVLAGGFVATAAALGFIVDCFHRELRRRD